MNEDDSEQIAAYLTNMGFQRTNDENEADIALLVTCSVRAKPEEKAKSKLGELRLIKEKRPWMIIGVCGCMAQRVGKELKKGRPYLDFVVGTANISRIPELVCETIEHRMFRGELDMPVGADDPRPVPLRAEVGTEEIKSFVPVMYGCDNFCSYCVVPHVRGRERSRPPEEIVDEVKRLADMGRREITLLGQNVNSYGTTLDMKIDFADLLAKIDAIGGIERIRFTTSHPKDLSDKLIEAMRDLDKVCEHIHLAVQSGDDEVLARMNRKYTADHIRGLSYKLRQAIPDIAITTDFLVGFPGETLEQFENTLALARDIRFDAAFMFAYNPIPNTAAEKMEDQLTKKEKNRRVGELIKLQNAITCEINESQVGTTYEVLAECVSEKDESKVTGLTRQMKTVNFVSDNKNIIGNFLKVKAVKSHLWGFTGERACEMACCGDGGT